VLGLGTNHTDQVDSLYELMKARVKAAMDTKNVPHKCWQCGSTVIGYVNMYDCRNCDCKWSSGGYFCLSSQAPLSQEAHP